MATSPSKYKLNHTMIRVKNPKKTCEFYELLGMKVVNKLEFPDNNFDLYFLGFDGPDAVSPGSHWTNRQGLIELTHNHGTENDDDFKVCNGNEEPHLGFRQMAISIDDLEAISRSMAAQGFKAHSANGDSEIGVANIVAEDPDGYRVEIMQRGRLQGGTRGPRMVFDHCDQEWRVKLTTLKNRTTLRVKDGQKSLEFYSKTLGMTLARTSEQSSDGTTSYLLEYKSQDARDDRLLDDREGLLELLWRHGTEKKPNFKYHNGNDEPQGFGHLCISVDDLQAACGRFEGMGVNWKKRLTDGRMKEVAFILDPDDYWVEVISSKEW